MVKEKHQLYLTPVSHKWDKEMEMLVSVIKYNARYSPGGQKWGGIRPHQEGNPEGLPLPVAP